MVTCRPCFSPQRWNRDRVNFDRGHRRTGPLSHVQRTLLRAYLWRLLAAFFPQFLRYLKVMIPRGSTVLFNTIHGMVLSEIIMLTMIVNFSISPYIYGCAHRSLKYAFRLIRARWCALHGRARRGRQHTPHRCPPVAHTKPRYPYHAPRRADPSPNPTPLTPLGWKMPQR